jgi:hypothetical protein
MSTQNWRELANQELEMARSSRCSGNEGRARVCARRAAGHVVGEYLTRNDIDLETESALERLRFLYAAPDTDAVQQELIGHFLVHTTPEHKLPIDADLIAEVDLLARELLGESLP